MTFRSLAQYLRHGVPAAGPIAILLIEDDAAVAQTLAHHLRIGFRHILALSPEPLPAEVIPPAAEGRIVNLHHDSRQPLAHVAAVNAVIQAAAPRT